MPDDSNTLPLGGTAPSLTVDTAAKAIAGLLDSPVDEEITQEGADSEAEQAEGETEAGPDEGEEEEQAEGESEEGQEEVAAAPVQESAPVKLKLDDGSEITLEEARKGYLRQSDYTRRTQEHAREREQFSETQQQTRTMLEQAATLIQAVIPAKPDPKLLETDPFEYQKQRANWESWQEWAQTIDANKRKVDADTSARSEEQRRSYITEQSRLLFEARPELKSKAKRDEWKGNLLATLPDAYGFSPEEILETGDHRLLLMADDAAKWRALQKQKPQAMQKLKDAPPVQKPGARPTPTQAKAKVTAQKTERLRQTGRVEDAARLIADLL